MKQIISTILASIMAVLVFESIIVMADELALRGSRDASTHSLSSSSSDAVIRDKQVRSCRMAIPNLLVKDIGDHVPGIIPKLTNQSKAK